MSTHEENPIGGMGAAVWAVLATVFAFGAAVGLWLGHGLWGHDAPPSPPAVPAIVQPAPPPVVSSKSVSEASSSTSASNESRLVVRTRTIPRQAPAQGVHGGASGVAAPDAPSEAPSLAGETEVVTEVELVLKQEATAASAASSSASSSFNQVNQYSSSEHGRLGVFVGVVPGWVGLDWLLLDVTLPPWVVGTKLKVGLDVVGTSEAIGAGVSVGGKSFAELGVFSTYRLDRQGVFGGVGLRF